MSSKRYVIGIDLGTSNCALSYVDTLVASSDSKARSLPIRQALTPTSETTDPLLPSFSIIPSDSVAESLTVTPFTPPLLQKHKILLGRYAQGRAAFDPDRVIHSAKSWLTNSEVDRRSAILPWNSTTIEQERRLSPVEASALYLYHLKESWNTEIAHRDPKARFEEQEITVTVPASFDEVAQQLTIEATRLAGFPEDTRLLEEPQAAFYYFLEQHEALLTREKSLLKRPLSLVVCDVGGGTTDFSLFKVHVSGELERIAVSQHLLLGGDNIDLTLARFFESQLGERLSSHRWSALLVQARQLKEQFLAQYSSDDTALYKVSVPPKGSNLFEHSVTLEVSASQLGEIVLEGFFPFVEKEAKPHADKSGIGELGLPYASDCAVTKHLADFLSDQNHVDAVLFTGGTLKPQVFQERILHNLTAWQDEKRPFLLPNTQMEHAVAHGAARYGLALRRMATRIRGGYPHSVYLEVKKGTRSVIICILPKGAEAGADFTLDNHEFSATIGRPVKFQLYTSRFRSEDKPGDIIAPSAFDERLSVLPPLQTVLEGDSRASSKQQVTLRVSLNEIGLLKLWCKTVEDSREWSLDFNLRRLTKSDSFSAKETLKVPTTRNSPLPGAERATEKIRALYGGRGHLDKKFKPQRLISEIEKILKKKKEEWDTSTLRALWPPLADGITKRGRSLAHEVSFLSLAGFCLRPGYGVELDEFRIKELWRCFEQGLFHPRERSAQQQWWIMWRRVAAGLTRYQQDQIFLATRSLIFKENEVLRLFGTLERINLTHKIQIGNRLCEMIRSEDSSLSAHHFWTLERIASRIPAYAGNQATLPPEHVIKWFNALQGLDWTKKPFQKLCKVFSTACRLTGDRTRDVTSEELQKVRQKLIDSGAKPSSLSLLDSIVQFQASEQSDAFGEQLPPGLVLLTS